MELRIGRIVSAALLAEILGVVVLAILVTMFGPPGFEAATPFAEKLGAWVGPISGFVLCLLGGYRVAKFARANKILNGASVGIAGATLDLVIGMSFGGPFSLLLVGSNVGRIVGGTIGGYLAAAKASASPARGER